MSSPTADVSVRVAWADDAPAIAAGAAARLAQPVRRPGAGRGDPVRPGGRGGAPTAAWTAVAAASPATPATGCWWRWSATGSCGFAITGPAADPDCDPVADAELRELTVDPDERGHGHGSRLLQAAADTMSADRFTRAVTWAPATDDALRAFLTDAGWAADGAHRELAARRDRRRTAEAGPPAHVPDVSRGRDRGPSRDRPRQPRCRHRDRGVRRLLRRGLGVVGLSVAQTCVLSLLMFTGASQFALVGVVASGGSAFSAGATAVLLGTRNTLYGLRIAPLLGFRGPQRVGAAHLAHRRVDRHVGDPDDTGRSADRVPGHRRHDLRALEPLHPRRRGRRDQPSATRGPTASTPRSAARSWPCSGRS